MAIRRRQVEAFGQFSAAHRPKGVGDFGEVEMRSHYFMDVDGYLLSAKVLNYAGNEQE
ncbi:hypothetical protein NXY25_26030 [Bacteroides thetaiotaomicron]|nr:hypothetical protein [Bacteroides thetaiotaomicron]